LMPGATELFEGVLAAAPGINPKRAANWVSGEYLRLTKGAAAGHVHAGELAELIRLVERGDLSGTNAKQVLERHHAGGQPVAAIIEELGLRQISEASALSDAVERVIAANPTAVADYLAGKAQAIGFLVGQVMRETRGQANAAVVQGLLADRLGQERG